MLVIAKLLGGGCRNDSRTKKCLICDSKRRNNRKLNHFMKIPWTPLTRLNQAVIVLSMLNVVLAHYPPEVVDNEPEVGEVDTHYSRQWAVHIEGGSEIADRIAAKHDFINLGKIFDDFYHFEHKRLQKRSLTPHSKYHRNLVNETEVKWAQQQIVKRRSKRDLITLKPRTKFNNLKFNDVEWPQMWYLNRGQGLDMNVLEAWQEGISGNGVVVTILDDGLEKNHPDLVANYDPEASYDVNNHDKDPMPRYDQLDSNRHGTRCAGEVAAVANNSLCSIGVAFGASVGGVRMLDGDVTDAVEARSLSLNPQHIDIYSASWGPDDDGKTVDGPGELATRAFIEGVTKGRQGKGSIFVWASGNGGRENDNCNCDGYTNSIWTLSISSATEHGLVPWYSEACSSTLATTYSSGSIVEKQIVTTDLRHKCTNGHTGTSASAPLAAGICALALEANKDLTWRDMQHIVVRTARPANLKSSDWKVNGVGRNVSHSFGYGLMDASAMVKLARVWKTVPEQHRCEVSAPHVDKMIPPRSKVILDLNVTECSGVNFLEHVQAKISLSSPRRGDLQIYLTSPAGTRSTLLAKRPRDSSRNPFTAWPFMSVHTWGEMPFGIWQLEIHNEGRYLGRANLQEWSLIFYGTSQIPAETPFPKSSQPSLFKSSFPKTNTVYYNPKLSKSIFNASSYYNRKNFKNWKSKSTTSRIGKVSSGESGNAKISPTTSYKNSKTTQKVWYLGKAKNSSSGKTHSKTTSQLSSTHSLPLTIVLEPSGELTSRQAVPDIFQKYPKIQQLFPLYVNTGQDYNEENVLVPKMGFAPSYFSKPSAKNKGFVSLPKAERQNRYDTSSTRTSTEGKVFGNKKPSSRKQQQVQGHFEGWQMLFYGTEDTPNEDSISSQNRKWNTGNKLKSVLSSKTNHMDEDVSNHLEPEVSNRGWKDQATRRDDMMRTTIVPLGNPSSGCVSFSKSTSQCLECDNGMYLHEGRCETICPPATYHGVNATGKGICLPCHSSCLTCTGKTNGDCTSCREGDVLIPDKITMSIKELKEKKLYNEENYSLDKGIMTGWKEKLDDENPSPPDNNIHLSYGKRESLLFYKGEKIKKAVVKKILEPYASSAVLFYCYPENFGESLKSSTSWYYRMSVFFAGNAILLTLILVFLLWKRFCSKRNISKKKIDLKYKYLKMKEPNFETTPNGDNIIYLSSSSEEEDFLVSTVNSNTEKN